MMLSWNRRVRIVDKSGKSNGTLRLKRAMEIDQMRRKTYS